MLNFLPDTMAVDSGCGLWGSVVPDNSPGSMLYSLQKKVCFCFC